LRRFWGKFFDKEGNLCVSDEAPSAAELKSLHKTIKKVREDIENFSFNTSIPAFMICLNELGSCNKRAVLEPLTVLLSPFCPHISEELWHQLGGEGSVCDAAYPEYNEEYLVENSFEYPVSFNGKMRFKKELPLGISTEDIEKAVLADPNAQKWTEGKAPRKVIIVPGKIINIVL
jgi:leucyl-tRNA synthetase